MFVANYDTSVMIISNNLQTMFVEQSKLIDTIIVVSVSLRIYLSETEQKDKSHYPIQRHVYA